MLITCSVVDSIMGNLKAQAQAMSDEIDAQDEIIDGIQGKMESNNQRVKKASERTTALLA